MTQPPGPSSRVPSHTPLPLKKRNPISALGSLIGALAMSVIAGILLTAAITPVVAITGRAASDAVSIFENLPSHIDPGTQAQPSTIYAKTSDGKRSAIAQFYTQDRVEVGWDDISQYVKDAAVAVEDPGFYSHGGVNVLSAARAAMQNIVSTDGPGASTITMQYARNVLIQEAEAIIDEEEREAAFLEATETTIDRKLKEMRLAVSLEKKFSKNEILLGYLNIALFGRNVYGIESAARYYYNKSAKDLNLSEAASLIAIVNWPTKFQLDIEENIPANQVRRDYILDMMLKHGKITEEEHEEAINTEIVPDITPKSSGCSDVKNFGLGHFCNYVKLYIENDPNFGVDAEERLYNLARGGFQIDTTIDLDIQRDAYQAMVDNIPPQYPGFDAGAAATTIEVGTGRVLAMTQNRQFSENPVELENNPDLTSVNYNTDEEYGGSKGFQTASTFKAFTLANWLKQGRSLNEVVNGNERTMRYEDIPAKCMPGGVYSYGTFPVRNHLGINWGNRSVLQAMALSVNAAFAQMTQRTDLCDIIDLAEAMGVKRAAKDGDRKISRVPSQAYAGTDEVSPLTMAAAYAGFAGKGVVCSPIPIDSITNVNGEEVPFTKSTCNQAIDPHVAAGVVYALEYNVTNGIGGHARSWHGVPHFAKTGTTDDYWDHWTIGGSTKAVTAVWTGNVVGKVSTEASGLPFHGDHVFGLIVNAADAKLGGDPFDRPDPNALRSVMKTIPDTTGKSFEDAKQMLETLGFTVRQGDDVDSSEPAGTVARTNPEGGTQTSEGTEVVIHLSKGNLSKVPDVKGESARNAAGLLMAAGFSNIQLTCERGNRPEESMPVLATSPAADTETAHNTRITLSLDCSRSGGGGGDSDDDDDDDD